MMGSHAFLTTSESGLSVSNWKTFMNHNHLSLDLCSKRGVTADISGFCLTVLTSSINDMINPKKVSFILAYFMDLVLK